MITPSPDFAQNALTPIIIYDIIKLDKYFNLLEISRKENISMKKKLFILFATVAILMCLFALSVSAEAVNITNVANDGIPDWDQKVLLDGKEYALWELDSNGIYHPLIWYNNGTELASVRADNITVAGADTTIPRITQAMYRSGEYAELQGMTIILPDGTTFDGKATIVIANLNGVKVWNGSGGYDMDAVKSTTFSGSTVLKYIYLPSTINTVAYQNGGVFQNCTALEAVVFAKSASIGTIGNNFVMGCSSLKCVSLPASVGIIAYNSFNSSPIGALYLGETLTEITSGGNWNAGAFYNCANLYLVQNPFEYYGYEGTIPEKPDIYFFPNTLATVSDHAFRGCPNMNTTVVFGTSLTSWSGHMFTNWTSATSGDKNVVFLGNMTRFNVSETISGGGYIHFYFPNTTDKSVLTHSKNGEGTVYYYTELGYVGRARWSTVTWLTVEELATTTDGLFGNVRKTPHLENPRLAEVVEATCYSNKSAVTKCFCGTVLTSGEVENSMLDHEYIDDFDCTTKNLCKNFEHCKASLDAEALEHIEKHAVTFESGFAKAGLHSIWCDNEGCQALDNEIALGAMIFTNGGYSTNGDGGLAGGWTVDLNLVTLFNKYNEKDVQFGIFMVNPTHLASERFMAGYTPNLAEGKSGALVVEMTETEYSNFAFQISGFNSDELAGLELVITAYAYVEGEDVEYIQDANTVCKVTTLDYADGSLYTVSYEKATSELVPVSVEAIVPTIKKDNF